MRCNEATQNGGNNMLINLTKSVPLKELCKITALGYTEVTAQ